MNRVTISVGLLFLATGRVAAQPTVDFCQPSAETRRVLAASGISKTDRIDLPTAYKAFTKLQALLQEQPDQLFLHLEYQNLARGVLPDKLESVTLEYQRSVETHPDSALALYLYGRMLTSKNDGEAANWYRKALEKQPGFPRAHLALTYVYLQPPERDLQKAKGHLQTFLNLCPHSTEGYRYLAQIDEPEFQKSLLKDWRTRLEAQVTPEDLDSFPALWELEFRLAPVTEHPALRSRVEADTRLLRAMNLTSDEAWLRTLDRGYAVTGDTEGLQWVRQQWASSFPQSTQVRVQTLEDWVNANPEPALDAKPEQSLAYYTKLLEASAEWTSRWPDEPMSWLDRLTALTELDASKPEDVRAAGERLLATWENKRRSLHTAPATVPIRIAQAYVRKKVALDRVPELVRLGIEAGEQRVLEMQSKTSVVVRVMEQARRTERVNRWLGQVALFDAALAEGRKDTARQALGVLEGLWAQDEVQAAPEDQGVREQRAAYWSALAQLEELEGLKLEALMAYQTALVLQPESPALYETLEVRTGRQESALRLWTELGGTPAGWTRWLASRSLHRSGSTLTPNQRLPREEEDGLHGPPKE